MIDNALIRPGELTEEGVLLVCKFFGYSEPVLVTGEWWAFPPNGVMPVRLGQHLWLQMCFSEEGKAFLEANGIQD